MCGTHTRATACPGLPIPCVPSHCGRSAPPLCARTPAGLRAVASAQPPPWPVAINCPPPKSAPVFPTSPHPHLPQGCTAAAALPGSWYELSPAVEPHPCQGGDCAPSVPVSVMSVMRSCEGVVMLLAACAIPVQELDELPLGVGTHTLVAALATCALAASKRRKGVGVLGGMPPAHCTPPARQLPLPTLHTAALNSPRPPPPAGTTRTLRPWSAWSLASVRACCRAARPRTPCLQSPTCSRWWVWVDPGAPICQWDCQCAAPPPGLVAQEGRATGPDGRHPAH